MPLVIMVGLNPGHIVLLHGDPTHPPSLQKTRGTSPNFRPMSIVAKRFPISATAEHLLSVWLSLVVSSYTVLYESRVI